MSRPAPTWAAAFRAGERGVQNPGLERRRAASLVGERTLASGKWRVGRTTPEQSEVYSYGAVFPKVRRCLYAPTRVGGILAATRSCCAQALGLKAGLHPPPFSEATEVVWVSAEREVSGRLEKWGKQ